MFKHLGRNHWLLIAALFTWALGEGLWYANFRQLFLVELGATSKQVGTVLAFEAATRALLPIPAGFIADRLGAREVMLVSWFLGILGAVVTALAHSWQAAVPGLLLYALSAFAIPSVSAFTLQNLPNRDEPGVTDRVLTLVYAAYPAGLIISPLIGGQIAQAFEIRTCIQVAIGIFCLSTVIVLFTRHVAVQPITPHSERPRDLLRNSAFVRLCLYFGLTFLALYIGYPLIPNFLQETRGFSYSFIGILFSLASVGTVIGNLVSGRTNPRISFPMNLLTYWLALGGLLLLAQPGFVAVAFTLSGTLWAAKSVATARVAGVVGEQNQGLAFGIFETLISVVVAAAAWLAGQLYGLTPAHGLPFAAGLALVPLAILAWPFIRRSLPASAPISQLPPVLSPGD